MGSLTPQSLSVQFDYLIGSLQSAIYCVFKELRKIICNTPCLKYNTKLQTLTASCNSKIITSGHVIHGFNFCREWTSILFQTWSQVTEAPAFVRYFGRGTSPLSSSTISSTLPIHVLSLIEFEQCWFFQSQKTSNYIHLLHANWALFYTQCNSNHSNIVSWQDLTLNDLTVNSHQS